MRHYTIRTKSGSIGVLRRLDLPLTVSEQEVIITL